MEEVKKFLSRVTFIKFLYMYKTRDAHGHLIQDN